MPTYNLLEIAVIDDGKPRGDFGNRLARIEGILYGMFQVGEHQGMVGHVPNSLQPFNNPRSYRTKDKKYFFEVHKNLLGQFQIQHPELYKKVKGMEPFDKINVYQAELKNPSFLKLLRGYTFVTATREYTDEIESLIQLGPLTKK